MGVKYRVSQDHNGKTQYYGHFTGHNAEEALIKAYDKRKDTMFFDISKPFDIKHGQYNYSVNFLKED